MRIIIALTLLAISGIGVSPAHAQSGWNSQRLGNQTYYSGTGNNTGWSGSSQQLGNQTYSRFSGPQGQMQNCTSQRLGNQVYTNCD